MSKKIDYTNKIFQLLKVVEYDIEKQAWKCVCDCGTVKYYTSAQLQKNKPQSCGCLKSKNLVGKTFGRLTAIEKTEKRDSNHNVYYLCECNCKDANKNTKLITAHDLNAGFVKSCGCLLDESSVKIGKAIGEKTKEVCVEDTNIRNLTSKTPKNNTSGIKGVCFDSARQKWKAQITFQKKHYNLGRYDKKEDAAEIRSLAEENMFGNFLKWYEHHKEDFKNE